MPPRRAVPDLARAPAARGRALLLGGARRPARGTIEQFRATVRRRAARLRDGARSEHYAAEPAGGLERRATSADTPPRTRGRTGPRRSPTTCTSGTRCRPRRRTASGSADRTRRCAPTRTCRWRRCRPRRPTTIEDGRRDVAAADVCAQPGQPQHGRDDLYPFVLAPRWWRSSVRARPRAGAHPLPDARASCGALRRRAPARRRAPRRPPCRSRPRHRSGSASRPRPCPCPRHRPPGRRSPRRTPPYRSPAARTRRPAAGRTPGSATWRHRCARWGTRRCRRGRWSGRRRASRDVVINPVSPGPPTASTAARGAPATRQTRASTPAETVTTGGEPSTVMVRTNPSHAAGNASTARSR